MGMTTITAPQTRLLRKLAREGVMARAHPDGRGDPRHPTASAYAAHPCALTFVTAAVALPSSPLGLLHAALGLLLAGWTLLFLFRIVLTWYPQLDLERGALRLVSAPTEPLLAPTRRLIQPIGGVDVTPVVWVGLISLVRELLVGQQGLVTQLLQARPPLA